MNDELTDELKDKMLYRAFIAEEQAIMFRQSYPKGGIMRDTKSVEEFEDTVRKEVRRLEDTANVVTAVDVQDEQVAVAILLGESTDEGLVKELVEGVQYRIYDTVMGEQ